MTTPVPPQPQPAATPYVAAWALYIYEDGPHQRAFLTFNGRLVASATCATPAQEARIEDLFHRLDTGQAARRSAQATCLALERRP